MIFRDVKKALINIFGKAESGRYRTLGYHARPVSAESIKDRDRTVMVYYKTGTFDGSNDGPADHDAEYIIELSVSKTAQADLLTLEDPNSSDTDRAVALANMKDSRELADDSLDELIEIVFEIITDNRNRDLGLAVAEAADRWIPKAIKNNMSLIGGLMILTADMRLTCHMEEQFTGEVPVDGVAPIHSNEINTQGDEEETSLAGVNV